MKNVILSHDDDLLVYEVPNLVAENLEEYCMEFCCNWLWQDEHAEKYRHTAKDSITREEYIYVRYTSIDFIEYLNRWIFPEQQSILIDNLGQFNSEEEERQSMPEKYRNCPRFNF